MATYWTFREEVLACLAVRAWEDHLFSYELRSIICLVINCVAFFLDLWSSQSVCAYDVVRISYDIEYCQALHRASKRSEMTWYNGNIAAAICWSIFVQSIKSLQHTSFLLYKYIVWYIIIFVIVIILNNMICNHGIMSIL